MEELPDQITPEALEALVSKYEDRLNGLPDRPDTPEVVDVGGGRLERQALGAAEVTATGSPVHDLPSFTPSVEVTYALPDGPGNVRLQSSPARLLRVDNAWRTEAFKTTWKSSWVVKAEKPRLSLTFQVPEHDLQIAPPDRPGQRRSPSRYEVPPPATEIKGPGRLLYESGHEVEVGEETQLIYRPSGEGGLRPRPGGVYATFIGHAPAQVRIGTTWIDTPLIGS